MAKKLKTIVRLQITAGKANPAPPIGPALAGHGINLMAFCKEYNARTSNRMGEIIPAEISIFTDGSFTFVLKTPPASVLLKKAAVDSRIKAVVLQAACFRRWHTGRSLCSDCSWLGDWLGKRSAAPSPLPKSRRSRDT